jgi:peptidoglycan hydrolase-like protein with peptidoglycan-binding domain
MALWDLKTREALKSFQQQQGLTASGTLDDQTKQALGVDQSASSGKISSTQSGRSSSGSSVSDANKSPGSTSENQ